MTKKCIFWVTFSISQGRARRKAKKYLQKWPPGVKIGIFNIYLRGGSVTQSVHSDFLTTFGLKKGGIFDAETRPRLGRRPRHISQGRERGQRRRPAPDHARVEPSCQNRPKTDPKSAPIPDFVALLREVGFLPPRRGGRKERCVQK